MKRKLNENMAPEPAAPNSSPETFASFDLEPRLLRGIRDQKWNTPTPVQIQAIPLALAGKDIIARSSTGSGKTAAYLLPILHKTIHRKERAITALILVPTNELASQVVKTVQGLAAHCGSEVRVQSIAGKQSDVVQKAKLADLPDIIVATPARAAANINNGALSLDSLAHLVVDEADLVMGYGFKEDLDTVAQNIPKGVTPQVFLLSATLNTELDTLRGLFCNDPVILKLDDLEKDSQQVKQYILRCTEQDKFLLLYAFYKLNLITGKSIIFVGDVDRSYRVKLFLEQFGIRSAILNSELPIASRLHIVQEYNKGVYDILIASDESEVMGVRGQNEEEQDGERPKKRSKKDKESGVSRGMDFMNVATVLNFDFPTTYKSYFHRIGRTARAGKSGTALSFIIPREEYRKHKPTSIPSCEHDEDVLKKVEKHQKEGAKLENYSFDMKKLEPFRYRFTDALRAVTRIAIREARLKDLRSELVKSEKLTRYFEENPTVLASIRNDHNLNHPMRLHPELKHVPDYLLPNGRRPQDVGFVGFQKPKREKNRIVKRKGRPVRNRAGKIDPLKTFNKKGRAKK